MLSSSYLPLFWRNLLHHLHAGRLKLKIILLFFNPEDACSRFLQNTVNLSVLCIILLQQCMCVVLVAEHRMFFSVNIETMC